MAAGTIVPSVLLGLAAAVPCAGATRAAPGAGDGICFGLGTGLLTGSPLATKGRWTPGWRPHLACRARTPRRPTCMCWEGRLVAVSPLYQAALQACRASILIPVSSVASSVYFVLAGTWLFHEHIPADPVASSACAWPGSRWPGWCSWCCPGGRRRPRAASVAASRCPRGASRLCCWRADLPWAARGGFPGRSWRRLGSWLTKSILSSASGPGNSCCCAGCWCSMGCSTTRTARG